MDTLFAEGGLLSQNVKSFEARQGQQEMARDIVVAFEEEGIALIEAGTGIGKSLAYLGPAIYWALKAKEKVVISTHTIALQEQLLYKDIPLLIKMLKCDIQAALVKGMGNYVCLRKLQEEPFVPAEKEQLVQIQSHLKKAKEGTRSEIPLPIAQETWEKMAADKDHCPRMKCPHFKECYFFKAREKAQEAQILVVNHHLLLADLKQKMQGDKETTPLPKYTRLIVDEAHHLEKIALESFASVLDEVELIKLLHRLFSESHPEKSKLVLIQKGCPKLSPTLMHELTSHIPQLKKEAFTLVTFAFGTLQRLPAGDRKKYRITEKTLAIQEWKEVEIAFEHLKDALMSLVSSLDSVIESLKKTSSIEVHLLELGAIKQRIEEALSCLATFFGSPKVRWVEIGSSSQLYSSELNVAGLLEKHLFSSIKTAVLCSATLTSNRSFAFQKERLGLKGSSRLQEKMYDSPFEYAKRTLLLTPTDLPDPASSEFLPAAEKVIELALKASHGRAFILFTSYEMLEMCYRNFLRKELPFKLLAQGKTPRHLLLEQFKNTKNAVLFGTSSFWEGVDVPGDALGLVIIVKLPFQVPTEPLYEAYSEMLVDSGENPFFSYAVPQAIIRFKQGFGRLMRTKTDRGCVLCLDHRLALKSYGQTFVGSLPPSKTLFAPEQEVISLMREFYKQENRG